MPSTSGSQFLSAGEVEDCIRRASPVFHILVSPIGRVAPEIMSPYDKATEAALDGFALRPNTIRSLERSIAFSTCVYQEWIRQGSLTYTGTALPGISYIEATGRFRLDSPGPGSYPGEYFVDKVGLRRTLSSLADVALSEAVKQHLTEGGDERLHLQPPLEPISDEIGINKYYCPPCPVAHDTIIRSSCTCSPPSAAGFEAARRCLGALWDDSLSADDAFSSLRDRISAAIGVETHHHVILHPSGTDAEFTALLVGLGQARRLSCTGVVNIVVGAKEVGSNTATAACGRHFSGVFPTDHAACIGAESPRIRQPQPLAISGSDLPDGVRVIELAARQDDGSAVEDFDDLVLQTLREISEGGHAQQQHQQVHQRTQQPFFIVHAVDGSKLGSHITSRALVEQILARYGDRVLFVLDACQARTDKAELDWYLSRGAVVLITASKFYGAPGFCAAALVPHTAAAAGQLLNSSQTGTSDIALMQPPACHLGSYITQLEVPGGLVGLRASLPAGLINVGLLLRWTCGVTEMERFARVGSAARRVLKQWVYQVRELICKKDPLLQLLHDGGCGNKESGAPMTVPSFVGGVNSIVSFGVRRGGVAGDVKSPFMDIRALRRLHKWLTMDMSRFMPVSMTEAERSTAKLRCYVGQPVDLGDFAVLRLAMGASLASDMAEGSRQLDGVLAEDGSILDKMELIIKHWDIVCEADGK